jgi:hypothetical protein
MEVSMREAAMCWTAVFARFQTDLVGMKPTDRPFAEPVRMRVAASRPCTVLAILKSMYRPSDLFSAEVMTPIGSPWR